MRLLLGDVASKRLIKDLHNKVVLEQKQKHETKLRLPCQFEPAALDALQTAAESHLIKWFVRGAQMAEHRGSSQLMLRDFKLPEKLESQGEYTVMGPRPKKRRRSRTVDFLICQLCVGAVCFIPRLLPIFRKIQFEI